MITEHELLCEWLLHPRLADVLLAAAPEVKARTGRELGILSGHRTCARQRELQRDVSTAASCDLSTHTTCPATGVDIRLGFLPTRLQKVEVANAIVLAGHRLGVPIRWGGGAPVDELGIPIGSEWAHFDMGPRGQDHHTRP